MHVLVIGGTRYMGRLLVLRLLARGDRVVTFNRGSHADPFGDRIERIRGDRTTDDLDRALARRRFDAVVDFAAYGADDVNRAIDALADRAGHYVFVSTGQVYLVRDPRPTIAREEDFDGASIPRPATDPDASQWDYGAGKRAAEEVLAAARDRFPSTRIRVPVVDGPRDPDGRFQAYVARLLDGDPLIVPDGGSARIRHVDAEDVARTIAEILGDSRAIGEAFNLAQEETPSLHDLLAMVRDRLGSRSSLVSIAGDVLRAHGLEPAEVSPFSTRWMSFVDPGKAKRVLGFVATPLAITIDRIVASFLADPIAVHPGFRHRAKEIALADRLRG